nr:aldehyde dehydrogenase family protein [Rhizobium mongolense]
MRKCLRRWSCLRPSTRSMKRSRWPMIPTTACMQASSPAISMLRSRLQTGSKRVMINDSSDYRFDAMPFGGFKYGSMGRESVRFAYEDMTQPKVVCINRG